MKDLQQFRFWCQNTLPAVVNDSISYYEVLCKLAAVMNDVIANVNEESDELQQLKSNLAEVQKWIDNYQPEIAEKILADYIAPGVYFGLSPGGNFVAYVPSAWKSIHFRTTGYDYQTPCVCEFGHLVLLED